MKKLLSALLVILLVMSICPWDIGGVTPAQVSAAQMTTDNVIIRKTVKPTKIALSKTTLSVNVGKSATLKATVSPSNATDKKVTWSSSNKKIATVSSKGVVKGIKAGKVTITAKTTNGKTAKCAVTVKATLTPTPKPTPTPTPKPTKPKWSETSIKGDAAFVKYTQAALNLINTKSVRGHTLVNSYIAIIEQNTFSGMRAYDNPPTFQVGAATYTSSTTWYASCIVHDAYHSKLYFDALEEYGYVANDKWTGYDAEMSCLMVQIEFLIEIDAPQYEIDWANSLIGTNWWDGIVDW